MELSVSAIFATPTISGLARSIDRIRRGGVATDHTSIPRLSHDEALPLSYSQHRLWLMDQLGAGAGLHMRLELRLSGPLDPRALKTALDQLVERHETLRTRFISKRGVPYQLVDPPRPVQLATVLCDETPFEDRQTVLSQLTDKDERQPFDLERGPLFRATLIRFSGSEAVLALSFHHIVADGRSYEILTRELSIFYVAAVEEKPVQLPPLPVQAADFAAWQREHLSAERLAPDLAFWRGALSDLPVLDLPADRRRPAVQSLVGRAHQLELGGPLRDSLVALARSESATLAMVCVAAFQALLGRYTRQDDVTVGSPIANRTRSEVEGLIGFFANNIVLRADLSGNPRFVDFLRQVKRTSPLCQGSCSMTPRASKARGPWPARSAG